MQKDKLIILGSGGSLGVPVIGSKKDASLSKNPKDKRLRSAALLQIGDKHILIDVGPDFRQQALQYKITRLDGVIITHSHFDHIGGIDDLRVYYFLQNKPMPILLSQDSYEDIQKRFEYLIDQSTQVVNKDKKFDFHILKTSRGTLTFEGISFSYFSYVQANMNVLGIRYKNLAYVTDIKQYDEAIFDELKGIDTLVVSALRPKVSPVHFNLDEAVAFAKKTSAKQTHFIHISEDLVHDETNKQLPKGMQLAFDGLEIEI